MATRAVTLEAVWLPAVDAPAPGTESRSSFRLHRQPTVLVVDDDEQVRDVTGDIRRRAGLQVLAVARGSDAIKLFAGRHANIDCVLLDCPTCSSAIVRGSLRRTPFD